MPPKPPATLSEWAYKVAKDFGIGTVFAIVLGAAINRQYDDNRQTEAGRYADMQAHQVELMGYLKERNKSESQVAATNADLANALVQLTRAIERMCEDAKIAHNKPTQKVP